MSSDSNTLGKIQLYVQLINLRNEIMRHGITIGAERIKKLNENNFYLESLMVQGQLLESTLKGILRLCLLKRLVAKEVSADDPLPVLVLGEKELRRFNREINNFDDFNLGTTIRLFHEATGNEDMAISLRTFKKMRDKIIHKAFDGIHEIEEIESEAVSYLKQMDYDGMIPDLTKIHNRLNEEIIKYYPNYKNSTPDGT